MLTDLPDLTNIPAHLHNMDFTNKSVDQVAAELKQLPFFMTDISDSDPVANQQLQALQALAYDGEPREVASNFKQQGNAQYRLRNYSDAVQFYSKAIDVPGLTDTPDPADLLGSESVKNDPTRAAKLADDTANEGRQILLDSLANRAACNLALKNYRRCINDCRRVLTDIDPTHEKCLFRAGTALLAVDRPDEAIVLLEYGLKALPSSSSIPPLLDSARQKYAAAQQAQIRAAQAARLQQTLDKNLQTAITAHGLTLINSVNADSNPSTSKISLDDPANPLSDLLLPLLVLYPLEMQSDLMQAVDINTQISSILDQLFEPPLPQWATPEYTAPLHVYAQTDAGGLVRVGRRATLAKVFGKQKGLVIPVVDGVPRLYVVPVTKADDWVASWDKNHAKYLLYGNH